jgi:threonine dehydrogenase-like Zn-dependent dehydrogenase
VVNVIDRPSKTMAQDVKSAMDGRGADAILDAVGAAASLRDHFGAFEDRRPEVVMHKCGRMTKRHRRRFYHV